jgi:hypothetical protein
MMHSPPSNDSVGIENDENFENGPDLEGEFFEDALPVVQIG